MNVCKNIKPLKNRKMAIITIIILLIICFFSIPIFQYCNAPKTAENSVAIALSKTYNVKENSKNDWGEKNFLSFNKIYSTVKFNKFKFVVELSGSADQEHREVYETSFYAKIEITPFTNKTTIKKLTFDDYKVVK